MTSAEYKRIEAYLFSLRRNYDLNLVRKQGENWSKNYEQNYEQSIIVIIENQPENTDSSDLSFHNCETIKNKHLNTYTNII